MPHYLSQVSYTPEAWARLVANPQDRIEAVRGPIEKLGGRIHNAFFAFGGDEMLKEQPQGRFAVFGTSRLDGDGAHAMTQEKDVTSPTREREPLAGASGW